MNVTIVAYGTRGDVQPLVALGEGLAARGHRVRVLAGASFRGLVERHGLEAVPAEMDARDLMETEDGRRWAESGTKPLLQARLMRRMVKETYPAMMRDAWEACREADAIVSTATSEAFVTSIVERLGLPHATALLAPAFVPTRSGDATWMAPRPGRESALNYLSGKLLAEAAFYRLSSDFVNAFRRETLDLPPQSVFRFAAESRLRPVLLGYSEHVVPHPPDWPPTYHTTGYWFLNDDEGWEPPAALAEFLEAGDPPVYVGFGSMTGADAEAMTRLLLDAIARSGRRAVLLSGWASLGGADLPAGVVRLDAAPHRWLFPRMAAVVHHGGAGTTAAALRAGVPMVVVPHLGDQPFWGRRMRELGVAPAPIARPKLTAERLGAAIAEAATDERMRRAAAELGAKVRAEDGVAVAVDLLSRYLGAGRARSGS